jgi:murein DD-endopeptidase MepM/ murein hydrolase activator NlpD
MLLVQMLRDMRSSGSWDEGEETDRLGAESLFETIDVELASHLARVKGLGLQDQLVGAFDRLLPAGASAATAPAAIAPAAMTPAAMPSAAAVPVAAMPVAAARVPAAPVAPTTESARGVVTSVAIPEPDVHESLEPGVKPVSGNVTSAFGWRRDPFTNQLKFHQGVDLRAAYGQEVQAAGAGTVVFSGDQGGYGTSVVLEHADGTRTRYAHLSAVLVRKGDQVGAGEPVGRAGKSGRATGTHLHFEVIGRDGRRMAPQQWASADAAGRTMPPGMDGPRAGGSGD